MKNRQKWLIITAITVIFGLVVAACDNGGNHTHDWGGWTETTAATCSAKGVETRTCSGCGGTQTQDIDIDHDNHDLQPVEGSKLPTCTELGYGGQKCADCDYTVDVGNIPSLGGHTWSSWSFKTAATCITSEIEKRNCTVCDEEGTRNSETNKALGHTLNPLTKVSVSFGVFEDFCTRCEETHKHEFTYKIGDTGPAGGRIFYVADEKDGRPDGIIIQGYTGATGSFDAYTAYYLEAAPADETFSLWQAASGNNTLIDGITTWNNAAARDAGLAASIGVGRKDTQTIVNSAAFAALTDTAAQKCANKTLNGFTDWFLPSLGELYEMYKAKEQTGIPTTNWYWSSSQVSTTGAWVQNFDGNQTTNGKFNNTPVRAIRAF